MRDQQSLVNSLAEFISQKQEQEALLCLESIEAPAACWVWVGETQFSLLAYAVMQGASEVVEVLVTLPGVDLNRGIAYRGHSPLMIACRNGSDVLVERFIEAGAKLSFRADDGQTAFTQIQKISTFAILETAARAQNGLAELFRPQVLHDFCRQNLIEELANYFIERLRLEKWRFARGFSDSAKQLSEQDAPGVKALGLKLQEILDEMAALTPSVLDNVPDCLVYLKDLEQKFQAFYRFEHGAAFPLLDRSTISITRRGTLDYPVPKEEYLRVKKHSALPRFLLGFLQKRGIVGLVNSVLPTDDAIIREQHYSAIENSRAFGPFYGKFSRLLQAVLLVSAVEAGQIRLPEDLTLKQFIEAFFAAQAPLAAQEQPTFRDPSYLNSYLMNEGQHDVRGISDYMVDSFCRQLVGVYEKLYAGQSERPTLEAFCAADAIELNRGDFFLRPCDFSLEFQGKKIYPGTRFFGRSEDVTLASHSRACVIS